MKTAFAFLVAAVFASAAFAQSQLQTTTQAPGASAAPAPGSLNLNLRLDDATRRSLVTEQADEKTKSSKSEVLPSLGGSSRSFDPPSGSRPKSSDRNSPFPPDTYPGK
jgi:hypothetical protein